MDLEDFLEREGLTLTVNERGKPLIEKVSWHLTKFYASIDQSSIVDDIFLKGAAGNGETEDGAIADHIRQISEQLLVVGYGDNQRRIKVPRLTYKKSETK
jgi:hypothetical protein